MKKIYLAFVLMVFAVLVNAQNPIIPVGIGERLGDIELESLQGETYSAKEILGDKNILLMFPRGMVVPNVWCPICFYQYAEMAKLMNEHNLKEKYNVEILYVLPYPKDSVKNWHESAQKGLNSVEGWKLMEGYDEASQAAKDWADYVRVFFPEKFEYKDGVMDLDIPVLIDADKAVSRGMALFSHDWGNTTVAQNAPTVFLINKKGEVVFKYHSQYTNDRPTAEYLEKMMKLLLK